MGLQRYCASLLEGSVPCFVADMETDEIVFFNTEMGLLLSESESVLGKRVYDVIQMQGDPFPYNPDEDFTFGAFFQTKFYEESFEEFLQLNVIHVPSGKQLLVTHTLLEYQGINYNLCRYINVKDKNSSTYSFDDAMTECINILNSKSDEEMVPAFLELLGGYYQSEKAHLFRVNQSEKEIVALNQWTAKKDVPFVSDVGEAIDVDTVFQWLDTRNEVGIVEADKNHKGLDANSPEWIILNTFGIRNMVLSGIEDDTGTLIATVGLGNKSELVGDYRLLQAVSQFIEQKVTKAEWTVAYSQLTQKDILTGFGSRSAYALRMEEIEETKPKIIGVLFINVNGVKKINAEYGYAKGDSHIKKAAEIVKEHLDGVFYRIAGDEFVAFYPDISKSDFDEKVNKMYTHIKTQENPIFALGHAFGTGRFDLLKLIQEADTVMYINKQEYYHTSSRHFEDIGDSTLSDLLSYIDNDEFMVYLQPQVRLKDGSLHGAEALIRRFDKKNQTMVFPDQFIPLYEKKSVIRHVDIFVIEKVCQLLQEWENHHQMIPISVNLSRVTLLEFGIVDTISKICDRYQVPHHMLVIEVTERVGLIENDVESSLIAEFTKQGFSISLDDFGCAYSNIVTLAQITVNEVKIDKSLVDYLVTNKKNRVLVKNILAMCNELDNTSTLAEGIEDEEQAQLLRDYYCHLGQGYHYSRPIPIKEFFEKYIKL